MNRGKLSSVSPSGVPGYGDTLPADEQGPQEPSVFAMFIPRNGHNRVFGLAKRPDIDPPGNARYRYGGAGTWHISR